MSGIPTRAATGSKLPAPRRAIKKQPSDSTLAPAPRNTLASKRPATSSTDLEQGMAKKKKISDDAKLGFGVRPNVIKPLPGSMLTGRATCATSRPTSSSLTRRPTVGSGAAMRDRTNLSKKTNTNTSAASTASSMASKKIPSWDVKGRLQQMENLVKKTNERVAVLEDQNNQLQTNVEEKETVVACNNEELSSLKTVNEENTKTIEALKKELSDKKDLFEIEERKLQREKEDLEFSKSSLERKVKSLEGDLDSKMQEIAGLKSSVSKLTSSSAGMEAELKHLKMTLANSEEKVADLTKLSSEQSSQLEVHEENARAFETERRKLHNTIQELKGNIRVFCRIRPLLRNEVSGGDHNIKHIEFTDEKSLSLVKSVDSPNESVAGGLKGKANRYDFQFDKVFTPKASQNEVFQEISQLVQSAIDGYNVCVFAYGQTGSGKTFTMEGGENEGQEGMIPKTIEKIFEETSSLMEKGWLYNMEASFLEIYNEEIRDLLATEKNLKYDIKLSKENSKSSYVTNLKVEAVTSPKQISLLLQRARKNRAVAATNCNERSSRSHSVFQMKISGSNSITTESCVGMLNLVDLAGSERLKDSGSEGVRLTETKNINKSLANLGNVIMALAQKDSHIPYRNSKLTHLLQSSLGGNSKTLMFVNISPREDFFGESINSLRFATKVNQCQIGTATKKIK